MLKTLLYLFLVYTFCGYVTESRQFRFDYTYYPDAEGWLKLHRVPARWREARLRCHFEGALLSSPLNTDLLSAMKAEMDANNLQSCGVFTGVHATFSKGDYYSIEGVPLSKIRVEWAPDEPDNNEDSESCLIMLGNGTMADVKCSDMFPYLCYKKKTKDMVVNPCGTVDNEYSLDSRTGNCYKFHRTTQTWSRAYMTCSGEGAYLAIINSKEEADLIKDLFSKNPSNVIFGKNKDIAHMGFHDWGEHGLWYTIHGQTLKEAGYEGWGHSQPDNATNGQFCGAVFRSGLLDDLGCEQSYPFICEKTPDSLVDEPNE